MPLGNVSLLPDKAGDVLTPPAPPSKPTGVLPPDAREFGDALATRKLIYQNALDAARAIEPLTNDRHTLRLRDVDYVDPERFDRKRRKQAVLGGETLARRLRGTWELSDNVTGQVLDQRQQIVGAVPYITSLGTFTHRGNDYTLNHQQRLRPGSFVREKDNGELEAHANVLAGKGLSHRYFLDPSKGIFKIRMAQAEMPLLPLLHAMGASDNELRDAWGTELLVANQSKNDPAVLRKLRERVLRHADKQDMDESHWPQQLRTAFERMELDPEVTKRTLGGDHRGLGKDTILAITKKLLAVSRGEAQVDDRDALPYQHFYGPEDLIAERIRRDHGRHRAETFRKISMDGNLAKMPSGLMTRQIEQAILGSGLGQSLEEINPLEVFDKQTRVTRMGEGGIPSADSVPRESRNVQTSQLGFIDPVRTPESEAVGVDVYFARNARKGKDGQLYAEFADPRTGKPAWHTPQEIADKTVTWPGTLSWPSKRVPAVKNGQIIYAKKNDIDLMLPHFENAFSPLGNLVPLKSAMHGQRSAMAGRMLTQALPLTKPEAPLVQGAVPGTSGLRSFEEEYAKHAGAIHADRPGRVMGVKDGQIDVRYEDGGKQTFDLYDNFPFARKTYIHQTPLVQPGDVFGSGQPLAKSNYTDDKGVTAVGVNARTAYMPWRGLNYEDATVISESMAKRFTSEHAYQHELEVTDKHKLGKRSYVSLFPQKFERDMLHRLDDKGVIKPGEQVEYGQPLILAARQADRAQNKIHKKRQAGYSDESVLWEHHDPGVVTDVVWGKKGPVVLVKSTSAMQVGDKMSGRHGDKGVVAAIVPDAQMPHDKDGRPYEVLANPLGLISRRNTAQKIEAWLGKVAAKTGQPIKVEDFSNIKDLTEHARQQLAQHGLSSTEDLIDPEQERKIRNVPTGMRFYMKLHHTSEGKEQGRSGGGYTLEDQPAKGGATGCLLGSTMVETEFGLEAIRKIVERKHGMKVRSRDELWRPIIDWFSYRVPIADLVELTLTDGRTLVLTKNHEVVLADGSRKLAGDLTVDDDLDVL